MTSLAALTARTPNLPCRLDPDLFFSDNARDRAAAVRACRGCPLLEPCAAVAIETREPWGVWGGTTAADRRGFRDGRAWRFDGAGRLRQKCGSVSAYHAHFAYREQPCGECTAAWEARLEADRRARLEAEHATGGTTRGYGVHRLLGEPACERCREAVKRQSAATRRERAQRGLHGARGASATSRPVRATPGRETAVQSLAIAS
ncbi:WhiB family transcriptional regulator [Streptomyces sp. DSM 41014]|uniref:Transcriptional regulator WhiB n=1 Tax=Streptomyces hintoniae TaxID=3075521 RepID=A0ABU2UJ23_9ACTN|nr:WhiB family transcriptional regulator [Streptomyces sp. DSM 41014]MDT0472981.1 WhiB family transcriptional regulator [Streptomyces sp. DSM 41014]